MTRSVAIPFLGDQLQFLTFFVGEGAVEDNAHNVVFAFVSVRSIRAGHAWFLPGVRARVLHNVMCVVRSGKQHRITASSHQ